MWSWVKATPFPLTVSAYYQSKPTHIHLQNSFNAQHSNPSSHENILYFYSQYTSGLILNSEINNPSTGLTSAVFFPTLIKSRRDKIMLEDILLDLSRYFLWNESEWWPLDIMDGYHTYNYLSESFTHVRKDCENYTFIQRTVNVFCSSWCHFHVNRTFFSLISMWKKWEYFLSNMQNASSNEFYINTYQVFHCCEMHFDPRHQVSSVSKKSIKYKRKFLQILPFNETTIILRGNQKQCYNVCYSKIWDFRARKVHSLI